MHIAKSTCKQLLEQIETALFSITFTGYAEDAHGPRKKEQKEIGSRHMSASVKCQPYW